MNRRFWQVCGLLLMGLAAWISWRVSSLSRHATAAPISTSTQWNAATAASYLDQRELWWQQWRPARRDHGTICLSCHTQLPYAMVRPALQRQLSETDMPAPEKSMLDNIEYRVSHWSQVAPFYTDSDYGAGKAAQSRATEAVLNATILSIYDAQQGQLRPITRTALDEAWTLQQKAGRLAGGWLWQDFHLAPWESAESSYQGAALLLTEVQNAPGGYALEAGNREHLEALRSYLRREYAAQPVLNQLYVLWAAEGSPDLLTADQRKALLGRTQALQQADGGWRLASLDPPGWFKQLRQPDTSDGYATAITVLVLEQSGVNSSDPTLRRGLAWLEHHQQKTGNWTTVSLNTARNPESGIGRFMSDAATGYAVFALQTAGSPFVR